MMSNHSSFDLSSSTLSDEGESIPWDRIEKTSTSRPKFSIRSLLGYLILFTGATVALGSYLSHYHHRHTSRILKKPCGKSAPEAQAAGCQWDVLSFAWVPPACFDRELTSQFRAADHWRYYGDHNKTWEMTEFEFGQDTQTVYLTNALHKVHCAFSWLKLDRARATGGMVPATLALSHTEHCLHVLSEDLSDPDGIRNVADIQYPDCGMVTDNFPGLKYVPPPPSHRS